MGNQQDHEHNMAASYFKPSRPTSSEQPVGKYNDVGSKIYVYKQDPFVSQVGRRMVWLPIDVRAGPSTEHVVVHDANRKKHPPTDGYGNFLYDPSKNPDGFDAAHTLAVVEKVRLMFSRTEAPGDMTWQWRNGPIHVYPHAGIQENAFYRRSNRSLSFYHFKSHTDAHTIHVCRSWDIVSHETGHAILDAIQPGWLESRRVECGALHESFADLTAIFSVLDQADMCELVIAHTKGDLRNHDNILAAVAEEFGSGLGRGYGLRNAANNLKMSEVSNEVHDLSRVFTSAMYGVLVRIFMESLLVAQYSPAWTLYTAGKYVFRGYLNAIRNAPTYDATFSDVATLLTQSNLYEAPHRTYMREEFERREVFDRSKHPRFHVKRSVAGQNVRTCWGI